MSDIISMETYVDAFGPQRIFVQFHALSDYHILLLPNYHIFIIFFFLPFLSLQILKLLIIKDFLTLLFILNRDDQE